MLNWHEKRSAGEFAIVAIFLIIFSQNFTINLIREAKIRNYINAYPSYDASIEFVTMENGRNATGLYRLRYRIDAAAGSVSCDVLKTYNHSFGPYFAKTIRVTPKGGKCDDPYLTYLEYLPKYNAFSGAIITSFASILLIISSLKLKQRATSPPGTA